MKELDTLEASLLRLKKKMLSDKAIENSDIRIYGGQFVKIIRTQRGLSEKQLCSLINSHIAVTFIGERHPSFWLEYPFTPNFIKKFEDRTNEIIDEITQGLLFSCGFPTKAFVSLVAVVCCAEYENEVFLKWYEELEKRSINLKP